MFFSLDRFFGSKRGCAPRLSGLFSFRRPAGELGFDVVDSLSNAARVLKGSLLSEKAVGRALPDLVNVADFALLPSCAEAAVLSACFAAACESSFGGFSLVDLASFLGFDLAADCLRIYRCVGVLLERRCIKRADWGSGGACEMLIAPAFLDCAVSNRAWSPDNLAEIEYDLEDDEDDALEAGNCGKEKVDGLFRMVPVSSIRKKRMLYTEKTGRAVAELSAALDPGRCGALQKRLSEKGLCPGIAALFYGAPGTGKTESARQLALESGRDVACVDMSRMRGRWVGSSEKAVKSLFDRYNEIKDEAEKSGRPAPVLLLNEADGVLSARREGGGMNACVEDAENTMRDIFLDEMERFSGVLVATTNIEKCLDSALDRRFLFKVEFEKPDAAMRAEIIRDRLDALDDSEVSRCAEKWEMSGGEIDNVARRCLIAEVLTGSVPHGEELDAVFAAERLKRWESNAVGFGR